MCALRGQSDTRVHDIVRTFNLCKVRKSSLGTSAPLVIHI